MANPPHDLLATLDAKLAAKQAAHARLRQAKAQSARDVRRLAHERRRLVQAQVGALAESCGLTAYPLDVLEEVFLGIAGLLARYVETPAHMRAPLAVLLGGKEEG
jgi:hypothetical protein